MLVVCSVTRFSPSPVAPTISTNFGSLISSGSMNFCNKRIMKVGKSFLKSSSNA